MRFGLETIAYPKIAFEFTAVIVVLRSSALAKSDPLSKLL